MKLNLNYQLARKKGKKYRISTNSSSPKYAFSSRNYRTRLLFMRVKRKL
jgi:hypothetical protein